MINNVINFSFYRITSRNHNFPITTIDHRSNKILIKKSWISSKKFPISRTEKILQFRLAKISSPAVPPYGHRRDRIPTIARFLVFPRKQLTTHLSSNRIQGNQTCHRHAIESIPPSDRYLTFRATASVDRSLHSFQFGINRIRPIHARTPPWKPALPPQTLGYRAGFSPRSPLAPPKFQLLGNASRV